MFSLESPHRGDSIEYIQYTMFNMKKENHPKLFQICSYGIFFQGTQERVRNSRGKRAISVRSIEVLPYMAFRHNENVDNVYIIFKKLCCPVSIFAFPNNIIVGTHEALFHYLSKLI